MANSVLILCAGNVGYETGVDSFPLCLTELDGVSLLEKIINSVLSIPDVSFTFAILERDIERFHLDRVVKLLCPNAKIVRIPTSTRGSACTALLGACTVDPQDGLLIVSGNEFVDQNLALVVSEFQEKLFDAGTMIFRSVHPRYSYVRLGSDGLVKEAAQQNPISHDATAGVFWFARCGDFVEGAKNIIRKGASVEGRFYVAPVFNELILKQARIGTINISLNSYHPLKNERQIQQFELGS